MYLRRKRIEVYDWEEFAVGLSGEMPMSETVRKMTSLLEKEYSPTRPCIIFVRFAQLETKAEGKLKELLASASERFQDGAYFELPSPAS